jgi:hypothetical protein
MNAKVYSKPPPKNTPDGPSTKHMFHADCLKTWLAASGIVSICPVCNADILSLK